VFEYRKQKLPVVSLSFGIAAYPRHGVFSRDLLLAADTALYHAKETGRDRISIP
jgi:GGDEF domain-containing protein